MVGTSIKDTEECDVLLIKTDKDGNLEFQKFFEVDGWGDCIIEVEDGYLISGTTALYLDEKGVDAIVIKIDKNGKEIWNKTYGWIEFESSARIIEAEGGYLIAGYTEYPPMGGSAFIIKIDKEGNEIWSKAYGRKYLGTSFSDIKKKGDGYILAGTTYDWDVGRGDAWLLKIDKEGNEIWNKSFGIREATEQALALQVIDENHYIIAGGRFYDRNSTSKGWVVKCADYSPPKIKVVKPKNFFYIFDREILPTEIPIIIGDITVKCEDFDPMNRIDRVEFYLCLLDVKYEYIPRKIDYEPPYEWRWKTGMGFYELTVAAFYGNAIATVEKNRYAIHI